MNEHCLDKHAIADSFSRYADSYKDHAFLQQEIGQRLLERVLCLQKAPTRILDLGAGPGNFFKALTKAFPKAQVVGLDLAWGMCQKAKQTKLSWRQSSQVIQGDMESLPFKENSFDLIFSNCTFQWATELPALFSQIQRIMTPDGSLFFSSFGPDTLYELKNLFAQVSQNPHVHHFLDLHVYGDLMLKAGLGQPVVSGEHLTVTYKEMMKLFKDLKYTGARNLSPQRSRGLMSHQKLKQLEQAFSQAKKDGLFHSTYEVLYGHAVKTVHRFTGNQPVPLRLIK